MLYFSLRNLDYYVIIDSRYTIEKVIYKKIFTIYYYVNSTKVIYTYIHENLSLYYLLIINNINYNYNYINIIINIINIIIIKI